MRVGVGRERRGVRAVESWVKRGGKRGRRIDGGGMLDGGSGEGEGGGRCMLERRLGGTVKEEDWDWAGGPADEVGVVVEKSSQVSVELEVICGDRGGGGREVWTEDLGVDLAGWGFGLGGAGCGGMGSASSTPRRSRSLEDVRGVWYWGTFVEVLTGGLIGLESSKSPKSSSPSSCSGSGGSSASKSTFEPTAC